MSIEGPRIDFHDVLPTSCRDVLALAEKALKRYWDEPTVLNLYPMALLTSHVADWYVTTDLGLSPSRTQWPGILAEFAKAYPVWNAVRNAGNGLKHAKIEVVSVDIFPTEDMMWEHRDAWSGEAYGTLFEGHMRPVDRLCFEFIQEFSGDLMIGRLLDRLPELHARQPRP